MKELFLISFYGDQKHKTKPFDSYDDAINHLKKVVKNFDQEDDSIIISKYIGDEVTPVFWMIGWHGCGMEEFNLEDKYPSNAIIDGVDIYSLFCAETGEYAKFWEENKETLYKHEFHAISLGELIEKFLAWKNKK